MCYNSFGKVLALVLLVFFLLGALAFGLVVYGQYRNLPTSTTNTINQTLVTTTSLVADADDDPFLGPIDAPVEIIAFEDFQCPYCKAAEPIVVSLVTQYPNAVKFVYRDFPLYTIHDYAIPAARAGECADAQGKFWAWHDQAFINQSALVGAPQVFSIWAETAELDVAVFEACVTADTYAAEVQKDTDEGYLAGVRATPTYFVNGQMIEGVLTEAQWKELIDAVLLK